MRNQPRDVAIAIMTCATASRVFVGIDTYVVFLRSRSVHRSPRARRVDFYTDIPRLEGVTTWLESNLMSGAKLGLHEFCSGGFSNASWCVRFVVAAAAAAVHP